MNGCNKAFNSTEALQKHINKHFRETKPSTKKKQSAGKVKKAASSSGVKSVIPLVRLKPSSSREGEEEEEEEAGLSEARATSPVESESSKASIPAAQAKGK